MQTTVGIYRNVESVGGATHPLARLLVLPCLLPELMM